MFNSIQLRYFETVYSFPSWELAVRSLPDNILLKSRQIGLTTLELGDMYHSFCFRPGYVQKVVAYRDETVIKLKKIVDLLHRSAVETMKELGVEPYAMLPYVPVSADGTAGTLHEISCSTTASRIEFTTEGAKGEGRSATVNRIYGTEYSEWEHVEEVMSGLSGSLVKDGSAIVTLDFSAKGIGNAAHHEYQAAKRGESAYRAHFYGRNDFDYDAAFLETQRKRLRRRFKQEYPATDEEAFLKDDSAVFEPEDIAAVSGDTFFCDLVPNPSAYWYSHGVDPAEGIPAGDYTAISGCEIESGIEAYPPIRGKLGPRETAFEIKRLLERFPGVVVIERPNHGHAVIQKCEDLTVEAGPLSGTPLSQCLYVHEVPGKPRAAWKTGWPQGKDEKTIMESDFDDVLSDRRITLVSENGRAELRSFSRLPNGSHGAPTSGDGSSGKFYDDEAISKMLMIQGRGQARRLQNSRGDFELAAIPKRRAPSHEAW